MLVLQGYLIEHRNQDPASANAPLFSTGSGHSDNLWSHPLHDPIGEATLLALDPQSPGSPEFPS
ncbi:hypothetical protein DO97_09025 [Neosynechococcus sphagnicola sy1]|uniref:Uncharacterized protein n=1 Tax=Neosynechococcus sphagnicola sy1 TaxID=1497020 RepID=A0A098TIJ8_9CYAN|nr:hypothetical protein DO97_09025 [Neosynechococcus sphagnicola sy1]